MNISNYIVALAQAAEVEQPTLFPFPFKIHLLFSCLAVVFFAFQFIKEKKPYQLIMGIAIPVSLLIWVSENRTLFYAIGIIEAVLLLAAFVTAIIFKNKNVEENAVAESSEKTEVENAADETAEEISEVTTEENSSEEE